MDRIRLDLKITDYFDWTFDFEKEKRDLNANHKRIYLMYYYMK